MFDPSKLGQPITQAPTAPSSTGGGFDPSKLGRAVPVSQPEQSFGQKALSFVKGIPSALVSNETGFGESIAGAIIPFTGTQKGVEAARKLKQETETQLLKRIQEKRKKGEDVTTLVEALKSSAAEADVSDFDINPALNKTTGQIVGEAGGTLLDIATAGTYSKGIGFLPTKGNILGNTSKLLTSSPTVSKLASKVGIRTATPLAEKAVQPAVTGLIKPFVEGTKKLARRSLAGFATGEAYDIAGNIQEGKTGLAALTDGYGKYIGAAIPPAMAATGAGFKIGKATTKGIIAGTKEGIESGVKAGAKQFVKTTAGELVDVVKAKEELANIWKDTLKMKPTQVKIEERFGKNTPKFIAERPYLVPRKNSNGTANLTEAIDTLKEEAVPEQKAMDKLLRTRTETISLDDLKTLAKESIETGGTEREAAMRQVDDEIEAYARQYRNNIINAEGKRLVPVAVANEIKQDLWSKSKLNSLAPLDEQVRSTTKYRMGRTFADAIEQAVPDADVKALNSQLGDYWSAIELMENRNNVAIVKGGRLGKMWATTLGAAAGSQGGFFGTVIGAETANRAYQIISDPRVTSSVKRAALELLREERPTIAAEVEKLLAKERANPTLLLNTGSASVGTAINQSKTGKITRNIYEPVTPLGAKPQVQKGAQVFTGRIPGITPMGTETGIKSLPAGKTIYAPPTIEGKPYTPSLSGEGKDVGGLRSGRPRTTRYNP